jgi:hypothetical protein
LELVATYLGDESLTVLVALGLEFAVYTLGFADDGLWLHLFDFYGNVI